MRDEEKKNAEKMQDCRIWPRWSEREPVMENTEDALRYGRLIWPNDWEAAWLQKYAKKLKKKLNKIKGLPDGNMNQQIKLATYIQFCHEAVAEFRLLDFQERRRRR